MLTYIYPPATVLYELTSIENLREGASMLMKHIKWSSVHINWGSEKKETVALFPYTFFDEESGIVKTIVFPDVFAEIIKSHDTETILESIIEIV